MTMRLQPSAFAVLLMCWFCCQRDDVARTLAGAAVAAEIAGEIVTTITSDTNALQQQQDDEDPVRQCPVPSVDSLAAGLERSFYDCIEAILRCGADGYPLSFGAQYATRFYTIARPNMVGAHGKAWVDGTLICLQQKLQSGITATTDCDTVAEFAFGTHDDCYVDNGFCRLGFKNWVVVAATIRFEDIIAGLPSSFSILFRCIAEWFF